MKISLSPEEFWELILSHHPNYPCFDDDVVTLFGRRICAGCLFAYPTAVITFFLLRPHGPEAILLSIGLAVISLTRRFSMNRHLNFFFRFIAGIALGFGAGGLLWAVQTGNLCAVLILFMGGGIYAVLRYQSMKSRMREWEKELVLSQSCHTQEKSRDDDQHEKNCKNDAIEDECGTNLVK